MKHYITPRLALCKSCQRILISVFAVCLILASVAPIHAQSGRDNQFDRVEQIGATETTHNAVTSSNNGETGSGIGIGLATIQMLSIGFMFAWLSAFIAYTHRRDSGKQAKTVTSDTESPTWTETSPVGRIYKTGSR